MARGSDLVEKILGKAALANHGTEGSDRDVFSRVRDDHCVSKTITILHMTAPLGDESEAIGIENNEEISR